MKPIQIWLPSFQGGVARPEMRQDMQNAFRAWDGDHVVWVVPGWTGPKTWGQDGQRVRCVRGNQHECFRILHVGEKGMIVGPAAAAFPDNSVNGLLTEWLNGAQPSFDVKSSENGTDNNLVVPVPRSVEGGIEYQEACLPIAPASFFANFQN